MFKKKNACVVSNSALMVLLVLAVASCVDEKPSTRVAKQAPQEKNLNNSPATKTPSAETGIVKSIKTAGSYSYIEVDINGDVFWMASSISSVKVGEKITWNGHAMMNDFVSKSMGRTFKQIMFVNKVMPIAAVQKTQHSGKVVETMDAAGYSYIRVNEQGKNIWLAVPATKISVGQLVSWNSGAAMQNFSSKSLKRTFDEIFFITGVKLVNS